MFLHVATALKHLRFLKGDNVPLFVFCFCFFRCARGIPNRATAAAAYRGNDSMIYTPIIILLERIMTRSMLVNQVCADT